MADVSQLVSGVDVAEGEASLPCTAPNRATAALWIGVAGLVTWLVPTLGLPVSGIGLVLAVRGRMAGAERAGVATVLCVVGLALSVTMWIGSAIVIGKVAS